MDEELLQVLLPFAQAYKRQESYDSLPSNAPLYCEVGDCINELIAQPSTSSCEMSINGFGDEDTQLNYGHLRALFALLGDRGLLPEARSV